MSEPVPAMEVQRFPALTGLRWVAALLVFAHHAVVVGHWLPWVPSYWGFTGVTFFFVLSGFVLAWGFRPGSAKSFLLKRAARVYPVSLVALAICVPLLWTMGLAFSPTATTLSAALLQAWFLPPDIASGVNPPAWSLSCEIAFYAAFPLLYRLLNRMTSRNRWILTISLLMAAAATTALVGYVFHQGWPYTHPLVRVPEFLAGITLALEIRRGWKLPVGFWAIASAFLVGLLVCVFLPSLLATYVLVLPFVALIGAVATRPGAVTEFLAVRPLVYLGNLSFAFYLIHYLLISVVVSTLPGLWSPAAFALALVGSLAGAVLLHHLIEKPSVTWLGRRIGRTAPRG